MVFRELEPRRSIKQIKIFDDSGERLCEVTGLEEEGKPCPAYAQKVEDSGDGIAYCIYGGAWGLRFKPAASAAHWDLKDPEQWGEAYKVYADPADIVFAEEK